MATFSSDKVQSNLPTRLIHEGVFTETAEYSGSASFSSGDIIQMTKVPAGARVVDIHLQTNALSSANTTLAVGDGIDDDRYISAVGTTLGQSFTNKLSALGYEYSADDTVDILVRTVASAQTSNPIFRLYVSMVVDN